MDAAIAREAQRDVLENYLMKAREPDGINLAASERFCRLMGLPARGRCILVLQVELAPAPDQSRRDCARAAEQAVRAQGVGDVCFVPVDHQGYLGALTLPGDGSQRAVQALCSRLRESLKENFGQGCAVTIGASRTGTGPAKLPELVAQADAAAFCRIYDGADCTYLYGQATRAGGEKAFREMDHLSELNRGVSQLDPEHFQVALRHMFDDITACRLGRTQLYKVLVEVMALMFVVGLDADIPFIVRTGADTGLLNFEFVYHMESIEVEYESFLDVFLRIIRHIRQKDQRVRQYSSKVRRVMEHIEANYQNRLELSALAGLVDLSANYLCYLFKKETGFRLVEYVNLVRMEQAKKFLQTSELTAGQVGERVGFSDAAYFCTMFKRYTGHTITEYRNHVDECV